jgi:hypothetical protein
MNEHSTVVLFEENNFLQPEKKKTQGQNHASGRSAKLL